MYLEYSALEEMHRSVYNMAFYLLFLSCAASVKCFHCAVVQTQTHCCLCEMHLQSEESGSAPKQSVPKPYRSAVDPAPSTACF